MAGYVRQSVADIQTGEDILAAPLNAEFNAIRDTFSGSTGHTHDGTTGNGPKVNLTTSVSGVLPAVNGGTGAIHKLNGTTAPTTGDDSNDGYGVGSIWIDTTNDRFYICVDSTVGAAVWRRFQPYSSNLDSYDTITPTAAGLALLDDANAAAQRTTLGLAIGTDVQAYHAALQSISGLTTAANTMIYTTASNVYATTSLSSTSRSLLSQTTLSAWRNTLNLVAGVDILAYEAGVQAIAGLSKTDGNFIVGNGTTWVAESGATARASLGLGSAAVATLIDDDTMATATATNIASAESTKAYMDAIFDDLSTREYWAEDMGVVEGENNDSTFCATNRDAICDAISTISAAGGGVLRFGVGTYSIGRSIRDSSTSLGIVLKSNVILKGCGTGATIIKVRDGSGTIHMVGNNSADGTMVDAGIFDMTLDHNGPNMSVSAAGTHLIRIADFENFYANNLKLINSKQHCFTTLNVGAATGRENKRLFISNVHVYNAGEDGIRVFYAAEDCHIMNCIVEGSQGHGIHIAYGVCNVVNVAVYQAVGTAISPQGDGCLVTNAHIEWFASKTTVDLFANRPAAGNPTHIFRAADTEVTYYDNGVEWLDKGAYLFNGVWAITRGGWPTGGKSVYSNIKVVFNATETEPYVNSGTTNDAFRLDVPNCLCSNIFVIGKFRFGIYTTEADNSFTNVYVEGIRGDGIRLGADRNSISEWRVVSAGVGGAGSYPVNMYGSYTKVLNGYALDSTNVTSAIAEQSGEDYNYIAGNYLVASTAAVLAISGTNTVARNNIGVSYEYKDISSTDAPADTAENTLKSKTIQTSELVSGDTLIIKGWGTCSGTAGTKTIKVYLGTKEYTISSQASGDQQDWMFEVRATKGVGTTAWLLHVIGGEEGGTMVHQVEYSSISSGWTTGIKATKGNSADTITAYGFTVTKQ